MPAAPRPAGTPRKAGRAAATARAAILRRTESHLVQPGTEAVMITAMEIATSHRPSLRDSVMPAAIQAGCRRLFSEGMQAGFIRRGVTIRNPFTGRPSRATLRPCPRPNGCA